MICKEESSQMLMVYLRVILKELLKRHCSNMAHCEKCPYIYSEENCEEQFKADIMSQEMMKL